MEHSNSRTFQGLQRACNFFSKSKDFQGLLRDPMNPVNKHQRHGVHLTYCYPEAVFIANHLTDTDKQNTTERYTN